MINASSQSVDQTLIPTTRAQPVRRISVRVFWTLLGLEMILLLGVLAWALTASTPAQTPIAATGDLMLVRDAIWARLTGSVNDALVEVQPGISVRESNLRGFTLNGEVYYYYVVGNQNFDPLSRGAVSPDRVEVLLRDENGPLPVVIYKLRPEQP